MTNQPDAVEIIAGRSDASVFLTCEHASERFPEPWNLPQADVRLVGTHWAYDLGAAELTRELAAQLQAPAVLSRFSRLLCDPNRPEDSPTLFRPKAEGMPIELNADLDADEREARLARLYRPYHSTLDRLIGASRAELIFAVHSFTPVYEGSPRPLEMGVLFVEPHALVESMAAALREAGFVVALNEPYSGRGGFMYSAERHARRHGRRSLELEARQDIVSDASRRARVVAALTEFLS